MINFLDPGLPIRFWKKCIPEPNSGCWIWIAGLYNEQGYGSFWFEPAMRSAHIFSFEVLIGPIPEGLVLDHLCRTPCCVNPAHLEPVTQRTNIIRGVSPFAHKAAQTHCLNGHELSGDNLLPWHLERGWRACRTCRNEKTASLRAGRSAKECS